MRNICGSLFTIIICCALVVFGATINKNAAETDKCATETVGVTDGLISNLFSTINAAKCELSKPELWPKDYGKVALTTQLDAYDFVIVGAGSAGSVVASRLSDNPKLNVLVLEAGGDPPLEAEIIGLSSTLHRTKYFWTDYAERNQNCCQAMKDEKCYWPRGKMIGGTGEVNGNIFLLGHPNNFDRWVLSGNDGWSWQEIQKIYKRAIKQMPNQLNSQGRLILNNFDPLENYDELTEMIFNATNELGFPQINNTIDGIKIGYTQNILATVDNGLRMSTGKTYLAKVERIRTNLHVIKNALATKIHFSGQGKATAVEFILQDTYKFRVKVNKEIILSAGVINTPKLLLQSGIGPHAHLQKVGVPLIKDLKVGQNLHDHGMLPLMLKFGQDIALPIKPTDMQSIFDFFTQQKGALAASYTLMGFINSKNFSSLNTEPNLHLVSHTLKAKGDPGSFSFLGIKDELVQLFELQTQNFTLLQIMGSLLLPKSRGSVMLRTSDPTAPPLIINNYGNHTEDRVTLLQYVRYVQKLVETKSFRKYDLELVHVPIPECDRIAYDTDEYWYCYVKYFFISSWHGVGTCKMGPIKDTTAVVDARLRVHGVKGIRVIDASIMPDISSGNTNGATIIIAEKGAQMLQEDWS
ncbi:glucose dehydrogenase [FAD, quinone]-like isoform X2 [Teleopsis dalmanni]|uniref:glucose dehydrogenase [FAD, quinone]-like isoform X2 n=1 Tax=Teleopsis dalmanni TaxID=139649 RepID=UPI0018CCD4DF|nr:glucose dehydrogenase [FAD, quinone]-like isoform X2 [Teleopsis dalmanni]